MCYVNYVRESTAFMRYACDQGLTANERLLWYALFDVMNARAKGSDWPEGLVPIPNKRLLSLVPFGEDSMITARNKLKQRGLIDYQPGRKNAAPPMYQMIYFCPELSTMNAQNVDFLSEIPGKNHGNTWGNMQGNAWGNMQGNDQGRTPGSILNYKPNGLNRNPNDTYAQDDDDAAAYAQEMARSRRIAERFRGCVGREPTPGEIGVLDSAARREGVDADVLDMAIAEAAAYGARNPAQYAQELMHDWHRQGVKTVADLVDLRYDGHVREG